MTRWAFLTALVVVVGTLGAFALYTFEWRDTGEDDERARAQSYAWAIAQTCERVERCRVARVVRVAPGLWRVRIAADRVWLAESETYASDSCVLIQVDRFAPRADGWFSGASGGSCD